MYLQTRKLIHKRFDLIDVVQQILLLLHLAFKSLAANEEDVGQIFRLVIVAKGVSRLCGPLQLLMCVSWLFVMLRLMVDLIFLTCLWYSFNILGSALEGDTFSDLSTMSQGFMDTKIISILNFQRLNFSVVLVHDSCPFTL